MGDGGKQIVRAREKVALLRPLSDLLLREVDPCLSMHPGTLPV